VTPAQQMQYDERVAICTESGVTEQRAREIAAAEILEDESRSRNSGFPASVVKRFGCA
jgi:hypothetical protein